MNVNRGLIFWGIALVTGGAVALAAQGGYLDRDALTGMWRLWPLILVAIGLAIILARSGLAIVATIVAALVVGFAAGVVIAVGPGNVACGESEPTELTERHGAFEARPAVVDVQFNCGSLEVRMSERHSWIVRSGTGEGQPRIEADSDSLKVSQESGRWWNTGRQHWIVALPTDEAYRLTVDPNAADSKLNLAGGRFERLVVHPNAGSVVIDLTGATVEDLDLAVNAGSASIIIGDQANIGGSLHVNVGSIEVCTTFGNLSLTVQPNVTFSHNLDELEQQGKLLRRGNTWSTPPISGPRGLPPLSNVTLTIDGNAASFTLNPEGGCS
jgi:hypothetical protein